MIVSRNLHPGDHVVYACVAPSYMWFELDEAAGPRPANGRFDLEPHTTALVLAVITKTATVDRILVITDRGNVGWSWSDWFERVQ